VLLRDTPRRKQDNGASGNDSLGRHFALPRPPDYRRAQSGKELAVLLQLIFRDASQRKFDVLLFWALDRLSREGVLKTLQHLNRLTFYGVATGASAMPMEVATEPAVVKFTRNAPVKIKGQTRYPKIRNEESAMPVQGQIAVALAWTKASFRPSFPTTK
jgi:hypothetical protein